jgi:hypothetical protein
MRLATSRSSAARPASRRNDTGVISNSRSFAFATLSRSFFLFSPKREPNANAWCMLVYIYFMRLRAIADTSPRKGPSLLGANERAGPTRRERDNGGVESCDPLSFRLAPVRRLSLSAKWLIISS